MDREDKYLGFKRVLAFVASIGLWFVSIYFSYEGFKFESNQILWFGVVLSLVVTVVELVFNTKIRNLNPTLLVTGIISYMYGVYTNITGFYVLQHGADLSEFFNKTNWIIPMFAGIVCEVLPEALFAWAWGVFDGGDLLGNIGEIFSGTPVGASGKSAQSRPVFTQPQGQTLSKKQKPQMPQSRQMPISGSATNGKVTRPAFQQPKAAMIDDDDEGSIPSFVSRESSSIKKEPPPYHPVGMYASHSKNRERLDLE